MKDIKGFTLAETLITLGVIGIVAALTIPNIITKYQKQVTVTKLKAAYQFFSEVIERAKLDFGNPIEIEPDMIAAAQGGDAAGNIIIEKYINPYIPGVEKYKGRNINILTKSKERLYIIRYDQQRPYCVPQKGFCYFFWNHGTNYRYLFIDINGPQKPNIAGRDVFAFNLSGKKAAPTYVITGLEPIDENPCTNVANNNAWNGTGCAKEIIINSWKIPDDYPW